MNMRNLLISVSIVAIVISCAKTSDEIKRTEPKNLTTTIIQEPTTLITTSNPNFTPPAEGQLFDTVIKLCDLAFNSLKCEEDCFSSEESLTECVDEAKEIGITT